MSPAFEVWKGFCKDCWFSIFCLLVFFFLVLLSTSFHREFKVLCALFLLPLLDVFQQGAVAVAGCFLWEEGWRSKICVLFPQQRRTRTVGLLADASCPRVFFLRYGAVFNAMDSAGGREVHIDSVKRGSSLRDILQHFQRVYRQRHNLWDRVWWLVERKSVGALCSSQAQLSV